MLKTCHVCANWASCFWIIIYTFMMLIYIYSWSINFYCNSIINTISIWQTFVTLWNICLWVIHLNFYCIICSSLSVNNFISIYCRNMCHNSIFPFKTVSIHSLKNYEDKKLRFYKTIFTNINMKKFFKLG